MNLSVIIPTYNNSRYLDLCLFALARNSILDNEIIVHVDGSTDDTYSVIHKHASNFSNFRETYTTYNFGLYSAINHGMRYASGDYFIMLNDDIVVGPDWDVNLLKAFKSNSKRVLCPRMVEPTPGSFPPPYNCGTVPENFDIDKFEIYTKAIMKDELELSVIGMYSNSIKLFWKMNGIDERFNPYGVGGLEYLYRVRVLYSDYEFRMVKNSIVYHFSKACKRENNLFHLANTKSWDDKYKGYLSFQDANDLLEKNRPLFKEEIKARDSGDWEKYWREK